MLKLYPLLQPCLCCGIIKFKLQTHLLLGLAAVWLHFQDPLETAASSHGVSKQQVALALPQMALWVSDSEVHQVMTALRCDPSGNQTQSDSTSVLTRATVENHGQANTTNTV